MKNNIRIEFMKMHALGNDFVIFDSITQKIKLTPHVIRQIANRQTGIGCDQILVVEPPIDPECDFNYRIFNANGNEVGQCGNGARCFGRYVYEQGLTHKRQLTVGTLSGNLLINLADLSHIEVNLGEPVFTPLNIPLDAKKVVPMNQKGRYKIQFLHQEREVTILSMGNPHCIIFVPATNEIPVVEIGSALETHPAFPKGVNTSFVQVLARNHIQCRVFERGVGETLACGSAAAAAVVAGVLQEELNAEVKVDMPGGSLSVLWESDGSVILSGSTHNVFQGKFCVLEEDSF